MVATDLDVTDIITDPDLGWHEFHVFRQQQTIDQHGRANTPNLAPSAGVCAYGSVQPASGRTLEMLSDLTRVSGAIEIWTKYRLEGPSDTTEADIVLYDGRHYIVRNVQSWSRWGAGFVHVVCELYDLLAKSPATRVITSGG